MRELMDDDAILHGRVALDRGKSPDEHAADTTPTTVRGRSVVRFCQESGRRQTYSGGVAKFALFVPDAS